MLICGMPVVNMWWAQTPKLMKPVASMAMTTSGCPTRGVRAMAGMMVDMAPAAGRKMM
ncbi:hypothetical protein D3C85_1007240 [compost metagenome]